MAPLELPDWRRAHGLPPSRGRLRVSPDDFFVVERLGFEPAGEGQHYYLLVEKTGTTTPRAAEQLARHAGLRPADVGYCGMKDRHARTRQWFSVPRPAGRAIDWTTGVAGLQLLEVTRGTRKLRRGAHRGNRFRIVLRQVKCEPEALAERLAAVQRKGVPNYYGEQRFGLDAGNLDLALRLFAGHRLSRQRRSIALSAARSFLFNSILEQRVAAGSWLRLLPGDIANLDGSASVFAVGEVEADLERRVAEGDLHPTAALWGRGDPGSAGDVLALERRIAGSLPDFAAGLERAGLRQERRATRLLPRDLTWGCERDALTLEFELGRGAFATALLRELADYADASQELRRSST